ncbi:MAG: CsbD family protein [Fimbriimonadaceae bacterium]|nr:MAG: CsbD family protein [Fimbriimonadaceae bacterium]
MKWNEIEGHWTTLKGKAKTRWGRMTDDDFDQIQGRRDQLVGFLQSRYAMTLEQAETEVNHFVDECQIDRHNWFGLSNDADSALKGGAIAGAVVGGIAGAALGPGGAVGGAAIGGALGGAGSAAAVQAIDKVDEDGSPGEHH